MKIPEIKEMLEAGIHFGHQTLRWNPKMKPYLLAEKNGIHIIDLAKTQDGFKKAYEGIVACLSQNKKVLFVGTKKNVKHCIQEEAKRSGSHFVAERWLGGMLTNYETVRKSINKLEEIERMEREGILQNLKKKEVITIEKKRKKLESVLGGIRNMNKAPGLLFVVDIKHEHISIQEAQRLGIPTIAIVDSNTDPEEVTYPIPGNDDAIKSVQLITTTIADYILEASSTVKAIVNDEPEAKPISKSKDIEILEDDTADSLDDTIKAVVK